MTNINEALKSTGCSSMSEFSLRAGITRPALYRAFNDSPHEFNKHFNCAKFYRARRDLNLAKTDLELAQLKFDKLKKYEKEVVG